MQLSPPLSHQFVTWYLRSISKTKIVKLFCPCMSEHMIYIKNVTNLTQTLHQNVTNVTKQNIASKEILTIEFHTKYMKLFVNMLSVICVLLNTKFHNTSENFYFEVILSRTIVSCKVTNMTNRYMDFILDLDEEFNFQKTCMFWLKQDALLSIEKLLIRLKKINPMSQSCRARLFFGARLIQQNSRFYFFFACLFFFPFFYDLNC